MDSEAAAVPQARSAKHGADLLGQLRAVDQRRRGDAAGDRSGELREFAVRGRSRVLVVLLARLIAGVVPGSVTWLTATGSVLLMGCWPYLLAVLIGRLMEPNPLRGASGHLFALATTVVCVAMLAAGWTAWRWTAQLADCVSEVLSASSGRAAFIGWLECRLRFGRQLLACAGGSGLAALLVYAMSHQETDSLSVSVWIYLIAVWAGFIGGEVIYWLGTVAEIPLRLRRCDDLQLTWIDPAHTPAVVQLCRVYTRIAASTALGVLIAELSTLAVTSDHPGPLMQTFFIGFPVFAAGTALYVGIQPYLTLSHIVDRHIDRIVDPLMAQTTHPPGELLIRTDLDSVFSVYGHFRALRRLPIRTAPLLQYVTGVLASLIVFFLQRTLS